MGITATREDIRRWRSERGRAIAVLDDDPTGSQCLSGVDAVMTLDPTEIADALTTQSGATFVLTNTRGMTREEAVAVSRAATTAIVAADPHADIVSRGDPTLRGHLIAETEAIDDRRAELMGRGVDGVLLAPGYFEAGRFTRDNVHYATVGGHAMPIGRTEFAADATFGFRSSDLRELIEELSGGRIRAGRVLSVTSADVARGPEAVRDVLLQARHRSFIVVNGESYSDYETVVRGMQLAIDAGGSYLARTGPSFVRALTGREPHPTLTRAELRRADTAHGNGLIVVGSHVEQTNRQFAALRALRGMVEIELDVRATLANRSAAIRETAARVRSSLAVGDVLLSTSRERVDGIDPNESLGIARNVADAVSEVVAASLPAQPAWLVAKGGITSHEIAVKSLGMRRARVLGQLLPGQVSVFEPTIAASHAQNLLYIVCAGNVGDKDTLAFVVSTLRGVDGSR